MARHWFSFAAGLAVGVLFVATDSAQAQQRRFGGRLLGSRDRGNMYNDGYYMGASGNRMYNYGPMNRNMGPDGRYYSNMNNMPMADMPGQPTGSGSMRQSFFSGPPNSVSLEVRVPTPDAQLLIDGNPTRIRGIYRQFYSPSLEPGQTYAYEVTAKFMEEGKEVTRTQKQDVRPGQQYTLDFTRPHHPQP